LHVAEDVAASGAEGRVHALHPIQQPQDLLLWATGGTRLLGINLTNTSALVHKSRHAPNCADIYAPLRDPRDNGASLRPSSSAPLFAKKTPGETFEFVAPITSAPRCVKSPALPTCASGSRTPRERITASVLGVCVWAAQLTPPGPYLRFPRCCGRGSARPRPGASGRPGPTARASGLPSSQARPAGWHCRHNCLVVSKARASRAGQGTDHQLPWKSWTTAVFTAAVLVELLGHVHGLIEAHVSAGERARAAVLLAN
jgi:hypothetical protein